MQGLVQSALGGDRLNKIVEKLAEKAEGGDTKALDYLLTIGGFKPAAPQAVVINQFVGESEPETQRVTVPNRSSSPADKVAAYLAVAGGAVPETIAEQLEMPVAEVVRALDGQPRLFACKGRVYSLTHVS